MSPLLLVRKPSFSDLPYPTSLQKLMNIKNFEDSSPSPALQSLLLHSKWLQISILLLMFSLLRFSLLHFFPHILLFTIHYPFYFLLDAHVPPFCLSQVSFPRDPLLDIPNIPTPSKSLAYLPCFFYFSNTYFYHYYPLIASKWFLFQSYTFCWTITALLQPVPLLFLTRPFSLACWTSLWIPTFSFDNLFSFFWCLDTLILI